MKNISENYSLRFHSINSNSPQINKIIIQNPPKTTFDLNNETIVKGKSNEIKENGNDNNKNNLLEYDMVKIDF